MIPTPIEIACILPSPTAEVQQARTGREILKPLDQQWWPAMPPLVPAGHAFFRRPFIRIDRLQNELRCVIVS